MLGNIKKKNYPSVRVRDGGGMGFLLCGWVAAALCFQRCPDWDGTCGIGRRLPVGGVGPPSLYLAPVSFKFKYSLILLPGIRCETDIKFSFVVISFFFPDKL